MNNWLVNRLTPAKAKEPRWADFATALERLWEDFFDPEMSRLERLRSSYTADDADLAKKIRQMGDYFSFEMPKEADRPIALAWRRLEIEYKDMELILRSVFRRHFGDFPVEWYPLFAPSAKEYGTEFITSDYLLEDAWSKNIPPDGYFLTSRGIVGVDKLGLFREGLSKDRFRDEAHPLVVRTKPLHIVFDGFLWFIRYDLGVFDPAMSVTWDNCHRIELQFGPLGARYDYTPADVRHADIGVFEMPRDVSRHVAIAFWADSDWHLDRFLPDGFGDLLPLDLVMPGRELMAPQRLSTVYAEGERLVCVPLSVPAMSLSGKRSRAATVCAAPGTLKRHGETERSQGIRFLDVSAWHLDRYLPDGFGDLLPLDRVRSGNEAADASVISMVLRELEKSVALDFQHALGIQQERKTRAFTVPASFICSTASERCRFHAAMPAFEEMESPLDRLPGEDGISVDFAPLDYPYGGYV